MSSSDRGQSGTSPRRWPWLLVIGLWAAWAVGTEWLGSSPVPQGGSSGPEPAAPVGGISLFDVFLNRPSPFDAMDPMHLGYSIVRSFAVIFYAWLAMVVIVIWSALQRMPSRHQGPGLDFRPWQARIDLLPILAVLLLLGQQTWFVWRLLTTTFTHQDDMLSFFLPYVWGLWPGCLLLSVAIAWRAWRRYGFALCGGPGIALAACHLILIYRLASVAIRGYIFYGNLAS